MLKKCGVDIETIEHKLQHIQNDVKLVYFTRETNCAYCKVAGTLYKSLASLTHKIQLESVNFAFDSNKDKKFDIFAVPALAVLAPRIHGISYYGLPWGQELNDFLDDLIYISRSENSLPEEVNEKLTILHRNVKLKIFISPECPYSLPAAKLGVKLSVASAHISVDIINAPEFLELAQRYNVRGIPMTVVSERESFYDALKPVEYVENILKQVVKIKKAA
jgi:glutaredoxin-like protein